MKENAKKTLTMLSPDSVRVVYNTNNNNNKNMRGKCLKTLTMLSPDSVGVV